VFFHRFFIFQSNLFNFLIQQFFHIFFCNAKIIAHLQTHYRTIHMLHPQDSHIKIQYTWHTYRTLQYTWYTHTILQNIRYTHMVHIQDVAIHMIHKEDVTICMVQTHTLQYTWYKHKILQNTHRTSQ